jgi:multiple antibiotic resistance protein
MAVRSTFVAALVLYLFAVFGEAFLGALGISLDAFRVAGGIMLFIIALEMVFEKRTERREHRAEDVKAHPEHEDISIFPMAIPMIAGPGSIASVMLMTSKSSGMEQSLVVFGALAVILIVNMFALLAAGPLMTFLGYRIEAMITRILGVILAALAAPFVIDGIKASFASA